MGVDFNALEASAITAALGTAEQWGADVSGPEAPTSCLNAGDTAWMLIATVLVLGMFPGVAFFELGLLRKKNTTSIIAQIFCGLPVLSTMWFMFGYSLTFGPDIGDVGILGDLSECFLATVSFESCREEEQIPSALYALFQMMFACITPLLMTGAYAERLAWRPFVALTCLWELFVYYPVAHWIWHPHGWLNKIGVQDFAGGIVIHTTAGVSSLVCVMLLGRRHNYHKKKGLFPYSNLPFACVGATLLWTGWFGFNGGSAFGANSVALHAVVNSQIAASVCCTTMLAITYYHTHTPSTIVMLNGAIAGLAGVTPASGYITPVSTFVLAIVLAISCELGTWILRDKCKIDDALEVSVVHGLTGVVGALYIGIAGSKAVNPDSADGLVYTAGKDWTLLGVQFLGVSVAGGWAALVTYTILKGVSYFTPLRVSHAHEVKGLDAAIHLETASVSQSVTSTAGRLRLHSNAVTVEAAESSSESDDEPVVADIRPSEPHSMFNERPDNNSVMVNLRGSGLGPAPALSLSLDVLEYLAAKGELQTLTTALRNQAQGQPQQQQQQQQSPHILGLGGAAARQQDDDDIQGGSSAAPYDQRNGDGNGNGVANERRPLLSKK
ncbi:Ammonium transporter 1 [Diplonema papillatum]|nr:Ammonium transporter 1 [Diplonema papillatum]|eukprot:gene6298-9649_t